MAKILITVMLSVLLTWAIEALPKYIEIRIKIPSFTIPEGAIVQFDNDRCPDGWDDYKKVEGKGKGIITCIRK
jgi:hypothetical protein